MLLPTHPYRPLGGASMRLDDNRGRKDTAVLALDRRRFTVYECQRDLTSSILLNETARRAIARETVFMERSYLPGEECHAPVKTLSLSCWALCIRRSSESSKLQALFLSRDHDNQLTAGRQSGDNPCSAYRYSCGYSSSLLSRTGFVAHTESSQVVQHGRHVTRQPTRTRRVR